ncbi:band 3 anion transport protein isoform X2 [Cydia pomonella]|uniref:band 3 anion transport protein isoform X2 n=1 Tax=Cydia pomonella TaxID=82600 RepID=UPI002ADD6816|nr:band 3 anion transport protein isoform X2 [Cydia pomonella]
MSSGKRKLSFLGFAPSQAEGEEIHLDEEMDRVVWGETRAEPLDATRYRASTEPRRDSAAPVPPEYESTRGGLGWSSSETSPAEPSQTSTMSPSQTTSTSSSMSPREDGDRHVQFDGPAPATPDPGTTTNDDSDLRREQRTARLHHRHQGRKYSLQEGARGGTDRMDRPAPTERVSTAEELREADADDLASHRTDDPKGLRRHLIHQTKDTSTVHVGRREGGDRLNSLINEKKLYDHSPHSVFVQLDELLATGDGDAEWKETARWIKYEEDVEESAGRWGQPHVASLSFHSLLNLRRCLETGVVLLDLEERDLPGVAYRVVERMVDDGLIEEDDKPVVMRSLLLRHRHVHDDRFRFSIGRKHASYTSLQNLADPRRRRSSYAIPLDKPSMQELKKKVSTAGSEKIDLKEVEYAVAGSQDELRRGHNEAIMKRIPEDAEATTVLVGAVGFLDQPTIAFVRLAQGILMPSITEVPIPVRFMFILLGPVTAELDYHEVGRSISTLMANPSFHNIAYKADDRRDLLSAINEFLDDSIVLPPGDWERQALLPMDELRAKSEMIRRRKANALEKKRASVAAGAGAVTISEEKQALLRMETAGLPPKEPEGPLERTGRLFGGVIRDIKRRYPYYISDFTDALNGQCVAATIFMYFAAVSSAITFGGLLATKTDGNIGITETLLFTCFGGIFFALLSGQPMMITGATGPLLLLDESLFSFCKSYGFDFLAARMYCGLWMIVIALLVASVEGSVAVKKITRFTEDIFAFLISLIFIGEPITSLINVYRAHPLGIQYAMYGKNGTVDNATVWGPPLLPEPPAPQPNTALFCTILTLATFIIAYYLRIFRNGKFLGRSARRALGDFGVPIAIVLMVGLASAVPVYTDTLRVPEGLHPTSPRPWLVMMTPGLATIPAWAAFAMALPALMVYIIVFMETHIAELIIDKPERHLKKGSGFHMDIVIMSFVNCICGMFGAPWQCVATVRSVSHVSALTVMSTTHAPGDKPYIVEVKEQRLTGLLVSFLVGLSVLASRLLTLVPMAVLFGVFLYMGISALGGIQFWDRCILMLKPVKHHAQVPYVRRVPTWKMHMFTLVQLTGIIVLFTVKSSRFSLALPFFLVMMVPLRMSLAYVFTPLQLRALDGVQKETDDDEPDFYQEAPLP